ncbi:MAG: hypothetical protein DRN14_03855 [Thermoplasmata archaeon]|nr:MAG: hypothetical protein DRN14_03855 [Thermoplasmata archaeon]
MSNQIHSKGDFRREEYTAGGTIKPGYLVELNSSGNVVAHSTEGGYADLLFAVEDALQGNSVDDDYSSGDLVSVNVEAPGNQVEAWIKAGEDIAIGDKLISAGDGTLIENGSETSGTSVQQIIATATEAVDLSGSGAVDTKITVMLHV